MAFRSPAPLPSQLSSDPRSQAQLGILLSIIFIWHGRGKLLSPEATQSYIAKSGLPMLSLTYAFSVFMELGVGLARLVGLLTRLSGIGLSLWCLVLAALFHSNLGDRNIQVSSFWTSQWQAACFMLQGLVAA